MSRTRVFHLEKALNQVEYDWDTFNTMAALFMEHGPKNLVAIKAAMDARDSAAVAQSAHRLKGSVLQFCAPAAFDAAQKLEESGKAGDLTQAGEAYPKLESELLQLVEALRFTLDKGFAA